MNHEGFFRERLDMLRAEGRYRVFAGLKRRCNQFPRAFDHRIGAEVTVWCSNDYLDMGQHPAVRLGRTRRRARCSSGAAVAKARIDRVFIVTSKMRLLSATRDGIRCCA